MKIYIAMFSYGGVHPCTARALRQEVLLLTAKKVQFEDHDVYDDALISRSRSRAMSDFLRTDTDVMFSIDHDIEWSPGELLATADMAHLKKSIVGGMYSMRGRHQGCAGRLKAEKVTIHIGRDVLHEAEFVPGGFTAIPRVVVEEVLKAGEIPAQALSAEGVPGSYAADFADAGAAIVECLDYIAFYDFFRCATVPSELIPGKMEYLSEDFAFCWRARQANPGRKQYLWSKPDLVHHGAYGFRMAEAAQPVAPVSLVKP